MIYLDYNATTPVDPRVFEAMKPYFTQVFGNAASTAHAFGRAAAQAIVAARNQVAALLNVEQDARLGAREIIFTSGATESNNLAIKGVVECYRDKGKHIITQATEHKAVLDPCAKLSSQGLDVTVLPVDSGGQISLNDLRNAIRPETVLVSIMAANNETGTIQPFRDIGAICKERDVIFHSDATQAVGKIPVNVQADGVDLLSLSAHKIYGPKGVGALYIRKKNPRVRLTAQNDGGGHERGFRSGTLNVPGIVGLGMACQIAGEGMARECARLSGLRDRFEFALAQRISPVVINGSRTSRLPHVANLSFPGVDGMSLLNALDDIAVSSGSACSSASMQASHVLRAMSISEELTHSSLRFSLGRFTTDQEIDQVIEKFSTLIPALRAEAGAVCGACAS